MGGAFVHLPACLLSSLLALWSDGAESASIAPAARLKIKERVRIGHVVDSDTINVTQIWTESKKKRRDRGNNRMKEGKREGKTLTEEKQVAQRWRTMRGEEKEK